MNDSASENAIGGGGTPMSTSSGTTVPASTSEVHILLFQDYPPTLLGFAVGCCLLFMLVGVPGNICTIAALYRSKIHSATAIFIINLSVSDLMFCCFNIPLATSLYVHRRWIHGDALCMLYPFFRYGLVAVSIFTVLAITINRYVMIAYPRWYRSMYKRSCLSFMVFLTWFSAFVFLLPTLLEQWGRFGLDLEIGSCSILPVNGQSPKEFLFVVAFGLPCFVIIVCYARIFLIARKAEKKVSRGARKASSRVPAPVPSTSTTTTTTTNTTSSVKSSRRSNKRSRRFQIGPLIRTRLEKNNKRSSRSGEQGEADPGPEEPANDSCGDSQQRPSSNVNVDVDDVTQNYVVQLARQHENDPATRYHDTSEIVQTSNKRSPRNESSSRPSPHSPGAGILLFSDDEKPECDRITAQVLEVTAAQSERRVSSCCVVEAVTGASADAGWNDCGITNTDDDPAAEEDAVPGGASSDHPPAVLANTLAVASALRPSGGGGNGSGRAGTASVNFAITSIRRTASRYKRGSFRTGLSAKDTRLLKMILTIFLAFVACYLPITTVKALGKEAEWPIAAVISNLLIYLTTCINPLIYVAMSSEYRLAYKNLLTCRSDRECSTRSSSKNT